jgi:hypothetical protein
VQSDRSLPTLLAASIIRTLMEKASISETSVNFYKTTRRNVPEDSHLHIRRRENLKTQLKKFPVIHLTHSPQRGK